MIDLAREIIGTQPILTAFLAIGLGYLVGQISIGSFSLGVGAVLFVGLALGAFAPKAQITGPIGLIGLIMFLYGVGILYGRQFFEGMTGAAGRKYNFLAFVAVVAGLLVALGLGQMFGVRIGHTLGIFAGSMTSTATLQAALDVMGNKEPSIGYSVAYPFGVIGPILCIYFMTRLVQPKFPPKEPQMHMGEITLGPNWSNATYDDLRRDLPSGVQVTMVRKKDQNVVPAADLLLEPGDGLLVIDGIFTIIPPIAAFVTSRFEHSIANIYFIPIGLFIKAGASDSFWSAIGKTPTDFPSLTWSNFLIGNLLPVTIGNTIGGSIMVAAVYWFVYLRKKLQ
jgi:putative transport protein